MEYGPVDVLVLAFGKPKFEGAVLGELHKAVADGVIRVLDAMILIKQADGSVIGVDIEDLSDDEKARLGFIETGTRGLFDAEDSAVLAEGLVDGSAVVALAIENRWAVGLANALLEAGVETAISARIPAPIINAQLAAIAAIPE